MHVSTPSSLLPSLLPPPAGSTSRAVFTSASSIAVALAVLTAVVIVAIALTAGSYLPHHHRNQRQRDHRIETADFKFIDLIDPSFARRAWHWLRRRGRVQRIGLVNFSSVPPESRLLYGSQSDSLAVYRVYNT